MVMRKKMWNFEVLNMEGKVFMSYIVHKIYCADLEPFTVKRLSLAYNLTVPFWHIPPWEAGFAHSTP